MLKSTTLDDEGKTILVPGGMIHHWYGTVLVPDVAVTSVLEFVQSYDDRARFYPEVEDSRLLDHDDNVFEIFLRLKRKKILTVHYNTEHEVTYRAHSDHPRLVEKRGDQHPRDREPGQKQRIREAVRR